MNEELGTVVHVRCRPGEPVRIVERGEQVVEQAVGLAIEARDALREAIDLLEMSEVNHVRRMVALDQVLQSLRDWLGQS